MRPAAEMIECFGAASSPVLEPIVADGTEAALEEAVKRVERAEAELAALKASLEERIAVARARWIAEESERLADVLDRAVASLDTRIGDQVAPILAAWLGAKGREAALAALHEALDRILRDPEAPPVRVEGPTDLIRALKARVGPDARAAIDWTTAKGAAEVEVTAGETRIATALADWARALGEAVS